MEQQNDTATKGLLIEQGIKRSAHWFYWIAGLSIINTIAVYTGSTLVLVIGLGFTQIVDYIALTELQSTGRIIAFIINLAIAGLFVFFGYNATQKKRWAFITGLILYGIDFILYLFARDFIGIIFHIWAMIAIMKGIQLLNQLKKTKQEAALTTTETTHPE